MANANGTRSNGNVATAKLLKFDIVDDEGNAVGTLQVEPGVRVSQPRDNGKGGGKEYVVADCSVSFGESGTFGSKVTLWEPREKVITERAIVRSL